MKTSAEPLALWIPGHPAVKQRPIGRGLKADGTPWYIKRDPSGWEDVVTAAWLQAHGKTSLEGPLAVELDFYLGGVWVKVTPCGDNRYRMGRGDLDNRVKAFLDGLNGIAWEDDHQIVSLDAQSLKGREP